VTPIHKDGEKTNAKNYRPINVTSLVGKALEKHFRNKTADFLNEQTVFPDNQHGFRTGRSCTTMLLKMFEEWTAILDKNPGTHIHAVFLDWSKAFDKVPHERLLSKLEHYGIKGHLHGWFRNFLTGRTQRVVFGGAQSEPTDVPSGVIQGSVLGPFRTRHSASYIDTSYSDTSMEVARTPLVPEAAASIIFLTAALLG
jgi:Reverse transcriptase (RNA-dependent DNA polymerase)